MMRRVKGIGVMKRFKEIGTYILIVAILAVACVVGGEILARFMRPDLYMAHTVVVAEIEVIAEPNFTDIVQQSIKNVVHIKNETRGWQGSGVAISKDIILTARHVLDGGEDFTVTDNEGNIIKAYKAISHNDYDIGFLKVVDPNLNPCELATTKDLKLGQDLFVIGSPYGKLNFNSVTKGIVSGISREFDLTDRMGEDYGWTVAFTTDSAGHPGNSGCPIFTMDGKVRGILVGGWSPVLIIAMPVDLILKDIEEIEILFAQLEYHLEEKPEQEYGPYYNYKENTEYYRIEN